MNAHGPLHGLRVIDLTGDLGRFGTKLLAEMGAEVCRPLAAGSRGSAMKSPVAATWGGLLDWWFDAAKSPVELDLETDDGRARFRCLAAEADLVVEALPVGYLAERGIDHEHLVADNPTLTQVSLSPFGRTGPRAGWQSSDLIAGALGGVLSLTGSEDQPLNSWGWQNYNFGGFAAAISGLAGVRAARRSGQGQLIDLSLQEVVTGSIENLLMQYFYADLLPLPKIAARQGSLHWLGAYEVVPARTGNVMITPTPQTQLLVDWMVECGVDEAQPLVGMALEDVLDRMPEVMAAMRVFSLTDDAGPLFREAQARHIAFGEVQAVPQVVDNPQFAHRDLYGDIELTDGSTVRGPWRLVRFSDTPVMAPTPAAPSTPQVVTERWKVADRPAGNQTAAAADPGVDETVDPAAKPLEGLVVVDLSWVLAGPFATRLLGDLGADVIKIQTEERATLVNQPEFPYYPVWNRSKRSVTMDLKRPEAVAALRTIIERADVLVENYSSGVLERLGLGWDTVRQWNDRLVYISMSGCGHDGPWSDIISYAPTIHALCGLTYLTNPVGRGDIGCGFSLNDHAAGFAAALSVLAAIEARERTGRGQHIDMAQLEVGVGLIGPAIVDYAANGREAQPMGNVDALTDPVPNEVYRCEDGRFLAVTALDDEMWARLAETIGLDDDRLATVEGRRSHRELIDAAVGTWCEARSADAAMEHLQSTASVAAGAVQNAEDLVERDEQLRDRGFWLEADHDLHGTRLHDRFPAQWSRSELEPYRRAPAFLGEANFEVLTEIAGLDVEQVAEGIADGLFI